jgi:hypothetical protein
MKAALPRLTHSMRLRAALTLAALLMTACASAATPAQTPDGGAPTPAAIATVRETAPPVAEPSLAPAHTSTLTVTAPTPFATSRGDELEATDPDTVTLASGGPQVVEFFAFW